MPSGARSGPPPEPLVVFVDRALGRKIGTFLRAYEGIDRVELHDDHFPQNTPDTEWLAEVGARGWVVLTKDVHIKTNLVELDAVLDANVALFALARGHASAETMAAWRRLNRLPATARQIGMSSIAAHRTRAGTYQPSAKIFSR